MAYSVASRINKAHKPLQCVNTGSCLVYNIVSHKLISSGCKLCYIISQILKNKLDFLPWSLLFFCRTCLLSPEMFSKADPHKQLFQLLLATQGLRKKLIIWDNDANGLRICWHFVMPPLVCLKIKSEKQAQKFHTDDASLRRSGWCFCWVGENFSFSRTNQKHHSDLKSDGSSIWNFCAHFSDIIRWRRKMLAVFSSCEAKHRPIMKAQFCFLTRDKRNFQNMPFAGSSVLTRIFYTGVRGTHRKAKRGSLGRKTGQNV